MGERSAEDKGQDEAAELRALAMPSLFTLCARTDEKQHESSVSYSISISKAKDFALKGVAVLRIGHAVGDLILFLFIGT